MIKVIYNKTCGRCVQSEPLTSGMVGQPIEFEYSPDFDGLTLTAVFTNGKTTVDVLNPGDQCVIPHEVLDTVGAVVKVGIYAVRGNELVIPTVYANIGTVLKGADPSGDVSADPTLPVWAQIQGIIGNLNDLDTEAKNNLVAAINEAAQTGSGSASIAMRVDGGYIQYSTDNGKTWVNLIAEADLKGDKGDKGADGKDGAPGKDGTDGKDGANGITPHIGENGNWYIGSTDTGKPSRGEQGVKGDKGDKGADGAPGAKGDKGDAFTYSDFTAEQLAALKGEKGDTGPQGPQGKKGDTGPQGLQGIQGVQGPQGERGPAGADGAIGPQGPQGDKGDPGIPGKDGHSPVVTAAKSGKTTTISVDGTAIATVEDGADGTPGKDGAPGAKGDPGEKGDKGDTGPQGPQGEQGPKGETGAQGPQGAPGADYTLTAADKAEIADMVDGATIVQAPKYVNSTTEMTDVNRPYVLISTGHIWANANVEVETPITEVVNATDENPYHAGYRLGSDTTSDSMTANATGYFLTPMIDLTKVAYQGKTIQLHLEGAHFASDASMETWIQARVYGVDKSVLVNRYFMFADMTNDNNIAHHCNGTMSIAYNSETSATVTLSVPPTYGPSATPIGYIRFCAKGSVANSNITITYTGISTGVQWYDTGTTYGGGHDAQLAAKVAALNNEGSAPSAYNLLTPAVIAYYNKPAYPDGDYSTTNIVRATLPYRSDIPQPVTLKWQHNEDAVQTTISVNTSTTVLSSGIKQYDATGCDNYPIYNLLPNKTYYYTVTHLLADGSLVTAKTGSFTTSNVPWRLLKVDGIQNVRDLGGWSGLNGQKVKYEKLFRGSALDDSAFPDLILTGRGRTELVSTLGIRADLDLRYNYTESAISKDMEFLCKGYGSYAQAITTPDYRTAFKEILEWIVARLSESHPKPVYFHCQGGCDRTGTLSFLLLGLLGVSESDLAREYELSSFSAIGAGRVRNSTVYGYSAMVTALKAYSGNTLTEKFADFALTGCGVSTETITNFRNLMLE